MKRHTIWIQPLSLVGMTLIALILIGAILAPVLSPSSPSEMDLSARYQGPSLEHPFGLDQNGSDVMAQVLYGARISLFVGISVVGVSGLIGLLLGSIAGWREGWLDLCLMRWIEMVSAFPGFLLALALVAVLGPSIPNLILAMCATGWAPYARLIRGEVLHLKTRDSVQGAVALGASSTRILTRHIWPGLWGLLTVQATFGMAGTILAESGLSFLGLGAPPTIPTWGALLNSGRRILIEAPHVSLFPGLAILTLVMGFNLIGESLRRSFDPRRSRR